MANKTSFTAEEWKQLLESPMLASMAVTAAEPSGLWGMLKESFAAGGRLAKAKSDAATNELIKAVAADFESAEGRSAARDGLQARLKGSKPGEVKEVMHVVDMFPTLAGLAGAAPGKAKPLDGLDVWPTISEGKPSPRQEVVYNIEPFRGGVRQGDWKLIWRTPLPSTFTRKR